MHTSLSFSTPGNHCRIGSMRCSSIQLSACIGSDCAVPSLFPFVLHRHPVSRQLFIEEKRKTLLACFNRKSKSPSSCISAYCLFHAKCKLETSHKRQVGACHCRVPVARLSGFIRLENDGVLAPLRNAMVKPEPAGSTLLL